MKKIILILLLVAVSVGGYAQKKRVESTIMMDTLEVDYKTRTIYLLASVCLQDFCSVSERI